MKTGIDSTNVTATTDLEGFANRKLIRPTLHRELARGAETAHRERTPRPPTEHALSAQPAAKHAAPAEQTHAENFYYQKQMQGQTPMVVVTRAGETLHGVIEWYDKACIKLTRSGSQSNLLIYKSAIRYMYKEAELE